MPYIRLNNVTPSAGGVVSVPVAVQYGTEAGALLVGSPEAVTVPVWNETGDKGPVARGTRAHLFVAPPRIYENSPTLGPIELVDDYKMAMLDTIRSIKTNGLPLTDWADKLGNAYCFDYANPYTRGCSVGLTNSTGTTISNRFDFTRINEAGRIDAHYYHSGDHEPFFYYMPGVEILGSDWEQDGFDKNNMYSGVIKNPSTGVIKSYDINKNKSAFDPSDVNTHTLECYRGLAFEDDDLGNHCARDILVIVDWDDTMNYELFDGFDQSGFPTSRVVPGPKAFFAIAWAAAGGGANTRLSVTTDPDFPARSLEIDVYPAAPIEEFEFIPLGGGGGGGNKGKGGRAVGGSVPMRITSRGDVDYRHFLDLYDETRYPERNMFLTNFVGRIPYKLVEYDSSEAGGTGVIRVSTDLQFTHFVGASFSDDNVPRVYEVVSHRSMGGSPNVLLCTFRVCHLKDYFQHFGITQENELLIERSTDAGLYNPWLEDARILDNDNIVRKFNYGGGLGSGFKVMMVLSDNTVLVMPIGTRGATPSSGPTGQNDFRPYPSTNTWVCESYRAFLEAIRVADTAADSTELPAFVNGVLSKIRSVYLIPNIDIPGGTGTYYFKYEALTYPDPDDPLYKVGYIMEIDLSGIQILGLDAEYINANVVYNFQAALDGEGSWDDPTPVKDWTDVNSSFYCSIPWYGSLDVTGATVKRVANTGSVGVAYKISCVDGSITAALVTPDTFASVGEWLPWKQLPTIPIPSSSRTLSFRQVAERENVERETRGAESLFQIGSSVVGAVVTGALSKSPIAALATAGMSIVGISVANDARNKAGEIGVKQAGQNVTYGNVIGTGYQMIFYTMRFVQVKKREPLNVYSAIGYPCKALARTAGFTNGNKYWVSILGSIRGTSSYAQAVRGEIERDGIIYNYS